jgi:hypothetical protein
MNYWLKLNIESEYQLDNQTTIKYETYETNDRS